MRVFILAVALTTSLLPLSAQAPAASGSQRFGTTDSGVTAPLPILKVGPQYTPAARVDRIEGDVIMSVLVDAKGYARNMRITKKMGYGLDEKALEAVARWKFQPGMKNGVPVDGRVTVAIPFRLEN